jgi:pimeloyl-ACP methyl ester carboxylesterase
VSTVTIETGTEIWYEVSGAGPPLLHIHGSAFGHRNFERLTPIAARDFTVIDFDLPGFGLSGPSRRQGGIHGAADDVADLIRALGYDRIDVHGTSYGGLVGLSLAARHPDVVDHVVLSCFLARYDTAARVMRATWKRAALESGLDAVADLTAVAGFSRSYYERTEAEAQLASMREAFSKNRPDAFVAATEAVEAIDLTPYASQVGAPTLLVAGAEDNMTPFEPAPSGVGFSTLQTLIPTCQVVVIEQCGHYLVIEQPEETARHVKRFLIEERPGAPHVKPALAH